MYVVFRVLYNVFLCKKKPVTLMKAGTGIPLTLVSVVQILRVGTLVEFWPKIDKENLIRPERIRKLLLIKLVSVCVEV